MIGSRQGFQNNDWQPHIFLKFKESKEPTQFKLWYADKELSSDPNSLADRKSNAWYTLERARPRFVTLGWSIGGPSRLSKH